MKIERIYCAGYNNGVILAVDYIPTFLEKIFGVRKCTKKYEKSGNTYMVGGGIVWYNYPDMTIKGRFEELDVWLRKNPNPATSPN